jgi:hypothetical protein
MTRLRAAIPGPVIRDPAGRDSLSHAPGRAACGGRPGSGSESVPMIITGMMIRVIRVRSEDAQAEALSESPSPPPPFVTLHFFSGLPPVIPGRPGCRNRGPRRLGPRRKEENGQNKLSTFD